MWFSYSKTILVNYFTQCFSYNYYSFHSNSISSCKNKIVGQNIVRFTKKPKHNRYKNKIHVFSSNSRFSLYLELNHIENL
jgi:hypothetical protein